MRSTNEQFQTSLRYLLPLPALAVGWVLIQLSLSPIVLLGLIGYGLLNIALLLLFQRRPEITNRLLLVASLSDIVALIGLLALAGFAPVLGLVQGVSALRAWRYRYYSLWPAVVPALAGILYVAPPVTASAITMSTLAYGSSLLLSMLTVVGLILFGNQQRGAAREWRAQYELLRREHKQRIASLEASNNDLRERLRRMEALGESLRAINSSLSLDDVLRQILDSLAQMLGMQRIDNVALTLIHPSGLEHRFLQSDPDGVNWATALAQPTIASGQTIMLDQQAIEQQTAWSDLTRKRLRSAISVPLYDPDQPEQMRGALSVVSAQEMAFSPAEERHLISFSIQAIIAIRNAELHAQLSRERAMLSAVVRDMADGLIVYDAQGYVHLDNVIVQRALSHSAAHNGNLAQQLAELAMQLHSRSEAISEEVSDGAVESPHYYLARGTLVKPASDTQLAVLVLHDVTEQKVQEQRQREFIAKVAHELRNPLNTLHGFLKVVLKESDNVGKLTDVQREFLGEVDASAQRLAKRINELINYNRAAAGQIQLHPARANIIDLIISTCVQQQPHVREHNIELEWELPDQLPDIFIDTERINQVLVNLIENAVKATPHSGKITVSAELFGNEIRVHVTDTGVGIPPEQIDKVFLPFYQAHKSNQNRGPHLGLGLAICKQFVEAHGGKIRVSHSEVGKGTRFTFSLPLPQERSLGVDETNRSA